MKLPKALKKRRFPSLGSKTKNIQTRTHFRQRIKSYTTAMLLILLTFSGSLAFAQSNYVSLLWSTDDALHSSIYGTPTVLDSENNLFRCGTQNATGTNVDAKIQKWDSEGGKEWESTLNSGSGIYHPTSMILEGTDLYITGIARATTTSDANVFIAKVEEDGTVDWFETIENASDDLAADILWEQGDNGLFICGSTDRGGDYDVMFSFVNTSGELQWTVTKDYNGNIDGAAILEYSGSNLSLNGSSQTSSTNWDITSWLYTPTGTFVSEERNTGITASSEQLRDGAMNNGIVSLTGLSTSGSNTDFKVACLDANNNTLWHNTYDKSGGHDQGNALIASSSSFVATGFVTGTAGTSDILVRKYNLSGTLLWSSEFDFAGASDQGVDVIEDADNNYLILADVSTGSQTDVYLYYVDGSTGSRLWMEKISESSSLSETGISLESDLNGKVLVSYLSNETVVTKTYKYVDLDFYNGAEPHSRSALYIANSGQLKDASENAITDVKYYSFGLELDYYFEDDKFSIGLDNYTDDGVANDSEQRIDVSFENKQEECNVGQLEEFQQEMNYNYYIGSNSYEQKGTFEALSYPSLYENIDAFIHTNSEGFKMTFVLNAGANLSDIELHIDGSDDVYLSGNDLRIETINDEIEWLKPKSYTASSSPTSDNCVYYELEDETLTFTSNGCDLVYPYVIEIKKAAGQTFTASVIDNLQWSTFYGGNDDDVCFDARATDNGDLFIAGFTKSSSYPTGSGVSNISLNGDKQALIVKFNHNGVPQFGTVIGATGTGRAVTMKGVGVFDNLSGVSGTEVHFVGEYTGSMSLSNDPNIIPTGAYQQSTSAIPSSSTELFFGSLKSDGSMLMKSPFGGSEIEKIHTMDISPGGLLYFGGSTEGGSSASASSSSPPSAHNFPVFDPADGSFFDAVHPNTGNEKRGFVAAVDLSTYLLGYSSLITKDAGSSNTPFEAILDIDVSFGGAYCGKGLTYARLGIFNLSKKFAVKLNQSNSEWNNKTYFSSVTPVGYDFVFMGMDEGTLDPLLTNPPVFGQQYQSTQGEAYLVRLGEASILWDTYFGLNSTQETVWKNHLGQTSNVDDLNGRGKLTYNSTTNTYFAAASASGTTETQSKTGFFFEADNASPTQSSIAVTEDLYLAAFSNNTSAVRNHFNWGTMYGSKGFGGGGFKLGVENLNQVVSYDVVDATGTKSFVTTVATSAASEGSTTSNLEKYPVSDLMLPGSWFRGNNISNTDTDILISRFEVTGIDNGVGLEENTVAQNFRIFPNPASDGFYLEGLSDEKVQKIELYDINGKIVIEQPVDTEDDAVFISTVHLKAGAYIVKVNGSYNQKFIKL